MIDMVKKGIIIFMALLCLFGVIFSTVTTVTCLEEKNIIVEKENKIEISSKPIKKIDIFTLSKLQSSNQFENFIYIEPHSIQEAENKIANIQSYIEELQIKLNNTYKLHHTSPISMMILAKINSMKELIHQYEIYIDEFPRYTPIDLGEFKITAYCPCQECSGPWGNKTSTGTFAKKEYTVAVDPNVIPYGTKLYIFDKIYVAEDCGGAVKGNVIDIYFETHAETEQFGVKYTQVYQYQE